MQEDTRNLGERIEDYKLGDKLGEGGFAIVRKAVCLKTGLEVAIKMIDKVKMGASGVVKRVKDEVSIHSRLQHKHVLKLFTFFENRSHVFLVLELCHKGTIANYLKTHKCSELEASRIFSEIVDGVLYLHSHNILHRDLTLANILLTKNNEVKIADFGLATMLTRPDEKHLTMCGTPNFISPEVATRSSHGLEADVWGLGCMLYSLLVGHPPFDTDTPKSTLTRVVMGEYKIPSHLSFEAKDLVDQLLRKNPKERLKLDDIPNHPFLSCQNFLEKWRFPRETNDSGMCTMTTEGTHSLHQTKLTDMNGGHKKISPPVTVASILNECSSDSCNQDHTSKSKPKLLHDTHYSHPDFRNAVKCNGYQSMERSPTAGFRHVSSKSAATDSGEESEAEEHVRSGHPLTNLYQQQWNSPVRLRSRSEDRFHSSRVHSSSYLRSKLSGCELGEYACLPSKHSYHPPATEKSNRNPSRHRKCRHSRKNGMSTCSADCTEDLSWRPQTLTQAHSLGHRTGSRCDFGHCDDLKPCGHVKCSSLTGRFEEVRLDDPDPATGPRCSTPCAEEHPQCSSERVAEGRECRSRGETPGSGRSATSTSQTLDRRKSLDHQAISAVKSSFSLQDVCRLLFSPVTGSKDEAANGLPSLRSEAAPLSTLRLLPTRHRTKNAILSILESGEVVIEFLKKKRPSGEDIVLDVCRISGDGLRIALYQLNGGKGCLVQDKPPDLPEQGTDAIYSYESLPQKHWKKYIYAVRFVNLVRAKTPKVTFYSDKAKSHLMENFPNPDFESCFYQGGKVSRTCEGLRLIDFEGQSHLISSQGLVEILPAHARLLWDHFLQSFHHCIMLESCLAHLTESSSSQARCVFPVIVGRRPSIGTNVLREKENVVNGMYELSPDPIISPRTPMLMSFEASTLSTAPVGSKGRRTPAFDMQETPLSSRPSNRHAGMRRPASSTDIHRGIKRVKIPGIGTATQLPSGEVRIEYGDGSQLRVHAANNGISFYSSDSSLVTRCGQNDRVPDWLRDRLAQVPRVIQSLTVNSPSTADHVLQDVHRPKVRSLR